MNKLGCFMMIFFMLQEGCQGELRLLQIVDLFPSERSAPCSTLKDCFFSGFYRPNNHQPSPHEGLLASLPPQEGKPGGIEQFSDPDLKCLLDPRLREASSSIYDSDEGNRIIGENMNLYQYWSKYSGMEIKNPTDAKELYQSLELERSLNLSTPTWADRFWPELKRQSEIHFSWLAKSQAMQKMAAGPLLGLMIQRMQKHVDGQDQHRKYYIYSGKNSSLAGLLAIFGAFDGVEPSFGSTIVLELHRFGDRYFIRVLYFHNSDPGANPSDAPEMVVLRGCSEYCPFEKFKRLTTSLVPDNWEEQCGWKNHAPFVAAEWVCTVGIVLLFALIAS